VSDDEAQPTVAVDGLLRTLSDFTATLASVERERQRVRWRHVFFMWGACIAYTVILGHWSAPPWLLAPLVALHLGVARLAGAGPRTEVQLAAWRLRRVYELASRLEDGGRALERHRRLELELRLGEAQYLLNRTQRLGEPTSEDARVVLRQRVEALPERPESRAR
jgi:hypothetical protein